MSCLYSIESFVELRSNLNVFLALSGEQIDMVRLAVAPELINVPKFSTELIEFEEEETLDDNDSAGHTEEAS